MNKKDHKNPAQTQSGASQNDSMYATIVEMDDDPQLAALVSEIRAWLNLSSEEQPILTAHFVDNASITDVSGRLKRNANMIHGPLKRLMERIRKMLPEVLVPYTG